MPLCWYLFCLWTSGVCSRVKANNLLAVRCTLIFTQLSRFHHFSSCFSLLEHYASLYLQQVWILPHFWGNYRMKYYPLHFYFSSRFRVMNIKYGVCIYIYMCDRLCALAARVLATNSEVRVRFPCYQIIWEVMSLERRSAQPREYSWGATWKKVAAPV
jgi:hypothetical protein